jgi:hypothetical protein
VFFGAAALWYCLKMPPGSEGWGNLSVRSENGMELNHWNPLIRDDDGICLLRVIDWRPISSCTKSRQNINDRQNNLYQKWDIRR